MKRKLKSGLIMSAVQEIKKIINADDFGAKDLLLYLQALEEIAQTNKDLQDELSNIADVIFQLNVPDAAQAYIEIKDAKVGVSEGSSADANVILEMTEEVFKNLFLGRTDISSLYIDNNIKIAGNLELTNGLQSLLKVAVDVLT